MPADLMSAVDLRRRAPELARECPALWICALRGKDGPWKTALLQAWQKRGGVCRSQLALLSSGTPWEAKPGAAAMHAVLAETCRAMAHVTADTQYFWSVNVGRSVAPHSGWLPLMLYHKIIRKTATGCLRLGAKGERYSVILPKGAIATQQLGLILLSLQTPRTLREYAANAKGCCELVQTLRIRVPGLEQNSYALSWLVRTYQFVEMRASGIQRLTLRPNLSLEAFSKVFPDQSSWMAVLASSLQVSLVAALCRRLRYTGPVELLTMYACLFADAALQKYDADSLVRLAGSVRRVRNACELQNGYEGHPAVIVRAASEVRC